MQIYPKTFLKALGAWQRGWQEEANRRRKLIVELTEAIASARNLPLSAFQVSEICYRKRFLVPNNSQNGGDLWPLFFDGSITEGIASWSTNYYYAKLTFKKGLREGAIAAMFATRPKQDEIVLNICALWKEPEFREAVEKYAQAGGEHADALHHFGPFQSEVVLKSALNVAEIKAFCGAVPALETLCEKTGLSTEEQEDEIWTKMVQKDLFAGDPYWIENDAAERVIDRVGQRFKERLATKIAEHGMR